MLNEPLGRLYPNSVDATIVGNHGQLKLRFPLLFVFFIFLIVITALRGWRPGPMEIVHPKNHQSGEAKDELETECRDVEGGRRLGTQTLRSGISKEP